LVLKLQEFEVHMIEALLAGIFFAVVMAVLFAALAFRTARRLELVAASEAPLTRVEAIGLLREEGDRIRLSGEQQGSALRQELGGQLAQFQTGAVNAVGALSNEIMGRIREFGERLETSNKTVEGRVEGIGMKLNSDIARMGVEAATNREALRQVVESKLDTATKDQATAARDSREELGASFQRLRQGVADSMREASDQQKERLDNTQRALDGLKAQQSQAAEQLRATVEGRLDTLRQENTTKLEDMRRTVDEKLQSTLETRLSQNFHSIVEHLNKAREVFGEMRTISASVGNLNNVLTNPKLRGTFGEVQLAMLLEDFLAPGQYVKDAQVKEHSGERVEYAVRLPAADGEEVLLPVDAKFPKEDHEHMVAAIEAGDAKLAEFFRTKLESRIKACAKDICKKYINPPRTTERAILFLPTESLFAEVLRQPGLFDYVHRECHVLIAGPTTFAAILYGFQMNYRSVALEKRSSEVWKMLGAVRTEFSNYDEVVRKLGNQLRTASNSVESLGRRARVMDRKLREVETLPNDGSAQKMLGLDGDGDAAEAREDEVVLTSDISSDIVVGNTARLDGL
jgi:DNA recombination protein RmuC